MILSTIVIGFTLRVTTKQHINDATFVHINWIQCGQMSVFVVSPLSVVISAGVVVCYTHYTTLFFKVMQCVT